MASIHPLPYQGVFYNFGRVAQSVARLTDEPEVTGPIPGPATYSTPPPHPMIYGKLSITGESMGT